REQRLGTGDIAGLRALHGAARQCLKLKVGQGHARPLAEAGVRAKKKPAVDREAEESTAGRIRRGKGARQGKSGPSSGIEDQSRQNGLFASKWTLPSFRPRSRRLRASSWASSLRSWAR